MQGFKSPYHTYLCYHHFATDLHTLNKRTQKKIICKKSDTNMQNILSLWKHISCSLIKHMKTKSIQGIHTTETGRGYSSQIWS